VLVLLKVWQPAQVLGYGGKPIAGAGANATSTKEHGLSIGDIIQAWMPIAVLLGVVIAWTGPWSKLPGKVWMHWDVAAASSITQGVTIKAAFDFKPYVGGTAILASWIVVALLLRISGAQLVEIFKKTWSQMWGALLVGVFIFGLAYVYNFSGMAASLAKAFAELGPAFIVVAPILGFIGVALSGSNTSTNAMFGKFQALVGQILNFPPLLLPTVNSVGAEIGKPVAPQTASVGVSTTRFVRNEGEVIRHNFGWCLAVLVYLILISVACYLFFPDIMRLPAPPAS
ncbi:MAG: L-lactate permease, partial [Burkholderiaceae bacterium]|nr:L-lactate permease [Burkholderiaceae bacterium]